MLLASAADVGMGQPPGSSLRKALVALRSAAALGLPDPSQAATLFVSLLRWAGCTSHAHEFVLLFDDEIEVHNRVIGADFASFQPLFYIARNAGKGRGPMGRARTYVDALRVGSSFTSAVFSASCEVAGLIARELGVASDVAVMLSAVFERFDGRGFPGELAGDAIPLENRIVQVVDDFIVFSDLAGGDAGLACLEARRGKNLDPDLCADLGVVVRQVYEDVSGCDPHELRDRILDEEPGDRPNVVAGDVVSALGAIAQFADVKTPFTAGQTSTVASLAVAAAPHCGLGPGETAFLNQAALCHSLGRVSVPNGTWERPGALRPGEWDGVRLYPYYSEYLVRGSRALAPLADAAGSAQERLDGSGYYRGARGANIGPGARLLGAAVAAVAMGRDRPHRPALDSVQIGTELRREVDARRLDRRAVDAVMEQLGQSRGAPSPDDRWQLTARELDVLRHAVTGASRPMIGERLGMSRHTVDTHLRHIYAKLGVGSRAAAAVVAMQQGLIEDPAIA